MWVLFAFFVTIVTLVILFAGVGMLLDLGKRVFKPHIYINDSKGGLRRREKLLLEFLKEEGFFDEGERPVHIRNRVISSLIADCSKKESFFWDLGEKGIRIKENEEVGYSHLLTYKGNTVGFNWIGPQR